MAQVLGKKIEKFDQKRLAKAIQKTARGNRTPAGQAENFAGQVIKKVETWIKDKTEITAAELRLQTAAQLAEFDPDAAYLYENENKLF